MTIQTCASWGEASPWVPMTDARMVKLLGKLGEEVNEAGSAIFRAIIQGIDEVHPVTGKPNREWVLEELIDIQNCSQMLAQALDPSPEEYRAMNERLANKRRHIRGWLDMLPPEPEPRAWEWEYYHFDPSSHTNGWRREAGIHEPRPSDRVRNVRPLR